MVWSVAQSIPLAEKNSCGQSESPPDSDAAALALNCALPHFNSSAKTAETMPPSEKAMPKYQ
jgi:hypothetical protein